MFTIPFPTYEFKGPLGVPIQVSSSTIILLLVFLAMGGSQISVLHDFAFFGLLMVSVYLHELGHAWGSLIQGVPVRRIMLNGIGGACERNRSVTDYELELIVAMGPIVNLAIWAVASLILPFVPTGNIAWALEILAFVNLLLALFNLVPMMPLDGGKLFQLLLVRFMAPKTATRICAGFGPVSAVVFIPLIMFM